jgi:glycerol-3-phosphate acyltransferase PlsX
VRDGRAAALVSAGNTGAAMICAKMVIGTPEGVDRPALATVLPNRNHGTVLIDVGANVDSKPEQLCQFGVMGHYYSKEVTGIAAPRVGLLSIGEEVGKGNDMTRRAFTLLEASGLNFIGNVEGTDLFKGTCEVVVCDGFVGNVILKEAESIGEMLAGMMRAEFEGHLMPKIAYLLARPSIQRFRKQVDYTEYGGAPLLGLKGGCFIAHGRSNPKAIKNAIVRSVEFCQHGIQQKISDRLASLTELTSGLDPEPEATPPVSDDLTAGKEVAS